MLSLPKLFFTFILNIAPWISLSLISLKSKILPTPLILISLDGKWFEIWTIYAANFSPMEQKYSFIAFEILCLSKMTWLDSFKLTIFVDWDRFFSNWLMLYQKSFIFPLLLLILSEKYCVFNALFKAFTRFLYCL